MPHALPTWNGNVQMELKLTLTVSFCNVPAALHSQLVVLSTTASVQMGSQELIQNYWSPSSNHCSSIALIRSFTH